MPRSFLLVVALLVASPALAVVPPAPPLGSVAAFGVPDALALGQALVPGLRADPASRALGFALDGDLGRASAALDPGALARGPLQAAADLRDALDRAPAAASREADLVAAVRALVAAHRGPPLGDDEAARLAALPPALAGPLAGLVEVHLAQLAAVRAAGVAEARDEGPALALARSLAPLVPQVAAQAAALQAAPRVALALELCGVLVLDLAGVDSDHACDAPLVVDLGGDDVYTNNAGGAVLGAALLLDLAGNDLYRPAGAPLAATGGAVRGAGFLLDVSGDDTYDAALGFGAANGAGVLGAGFLLDRDGHDAYQARLGGTEGALSGGAANGGALLGMGQLLDLAGSDTYDATIAAALAPTAGGGANGGAAGGQAWLVDLEGDDTYHGEVRGPPQTWQGLTLLPGPLAGVNGGGAAGTALLLDAGGHDAYAAAGVSGAAQGGGFGGSGTLLDLEGDDAYAATFSGRAAANGAGVLGTGLLGDGAGHDSYRATVGGGAAIGAALAGVGVLADLGGGNTYASALTALPGALDGAAAGLPDEVAGLAVGLLLAGPGDDAHLASGLAQGAGDGGLGLLLDPGGHNAYAAAAGPAQGAGLRGGLGLLADHGEVDTFDLLGDAPGQGFGDLGAGLLVRTNPGGTTEYRSAAPPPTSHGLGVGLRVDLGVVAGGIPRLACVGSAELAAVRLFGGDLADLRVCGPDPDRAQAIPGSPVHEAPKPALRCDGLHVLGHHVPGPLCAADWAAEVTSLLGPRATEWVGRESLGLTVSGGLTVLFGREGAGLPATLHGLYETTSADRVCDLSCHTLGNG